MMSINNLWFNFWDPHSQPQTKRVFLLLIILSLVSCDDTGETNENYYQSWMCIEWEGSETTSHAHGYSSALLLRNMGANGTYKLVDVSFADRYSFLVRTVNYVDEYADPLKLQRLIEFCTAKELENNYSTGQSSEISYVPIEAVVKDARSVEEAELDFDLYGTKLGFEEDGRLVSVLVGDLYFVLQSTISIGRDTIIVKQDLFSKTLETICRIESMCD